MTLTTSWRPVLIICSHLRLGLPSVLLPSGFPIKILYAPFVFRILATCPAHLIHPDLITRMIFGEEYKSEVFSVPLTSSLLGPNTLFRTLFFKTFSLRFSLIVSDQVSYPYTTTGTIIVLYVLNIIYIGVEKVGINVWRDFRWKNLVESDTC